jgi:hypothetical protein
MNMLETRMHLEFQVRMFLFFYFTHVYSQHDYGQHHQHHVAPHCYDESTRRVREGGDYRNGAQTMPDTSSGPRYVFFFCFIDSN